MCVSVCVCMYVYLCVCVSVCVCMYVCVSVCMCMSLYACVSVCLSVWVCHTFLQNNVNQMLTFNCSSIRHFVQEVNEIWYLRSLIIALPGYQMSLTSFT